MLRASSPASTAAAADAEGRSATRSSANRPSTDHLAGDKADAGEAACSSSSIASHFLTHVANSSSSWSSPSGLYGSGSGSVPSGGGLCFFKGIEDCAVPPTFAYGTLGANGLSHLAPGGGSSSSSSDSSRPDSSSSAGLPTAHIVTMPTFADSYTASPHLSTYTASPALAGYLTSPALSNATTASPAMSSCTDVSPAASVRTVNDLEDEEGIMQWLSNTSRKRRRDQCATAQAALSALGSSANKQKWYRERNKEYSRNWRNKKRQEEESLKNEMEELKSFKQTIESSLDMISLHCGQSFTFAYASPGYSRLVGLEPQGLLGKEIGSIADADTGEILRQACSQAMTNGVPAEVQWMLVLDSQAVAVESSVRHARQGVLVYTRLRG